MTPERLRLVGAEISDGLVPPFLPESPPEWSGARWIGAIGDDDERLSSPGAIPLQYGAGFRHARLLVRRGQLPRGFIEVPVEDGAVETSQLTREIAGLPPLEFEATAIADEMLPSITVALCTRDRGDQLQTALPSLLALSYPQLKVLVVDNASRTDETVRYVNGLGDDRVRVVYEPRAGLSAARNRALVEADSDWLAFTDDDVVVDPGWLRGIANGIAHSPTAGIVCGMVATGELISHTQLYFERRVEWAGAMNSTVFDLAAPPPDVPLFPFEVGIYGTGANFAVDRRLAIRLGGFNEALGAGTPAGGGEDIDMFVRTIVSGRTLVREASAVVWHRHRIDPPGLRKQMRSYGTGMTAWITSTFGQRDTRGLAVRRLAKALRRLPRVGSLDDDEQHDDAPQDKLFDELRHIEVKGMLVGPFIYARSFLGGRSSRPLKNAR